MFSKFYEKSFSKSKKWYFLKKKIREVDFFMKIQKVKVKNFRMCTIVYIYIPYLYKLKKYIFHWKNLQHYYFVNNILKDNLLCIH